MKTIEIAGQLVGDGQPCFIIAEAGVNHNGRVDIAKRLVEVAAQEQANAVKFQKRTVADILIKDELDRPYDGVNSFGRTYGQHRSALELTDEAFRALKAHADARGIMFLASAWDAKSVDFVASLGVPGFKIASADLTNLPLLDRVARTRKPVFLSTGMSTLEEIGDAVDAIRRYHSELVLLHCVSTYPSDPKEINLRVMGMLRDTFDVLVGYSGHEQGLAVSYAAAALGACVIERHFTLDWTMPGPDHQASLQPEGLHKLTFGIRKIEDALGSAEKRLLDSERRVRERLAKSIVARTAIRAGTVISEDMLIMKGPGSGLQPRLISKICGAIAAVDVAADTLLPVDAVQWPRADGHEEPR